MSAIALPQGTFHHIGFVVASIQTSVKGFLDSLQAEWDGTIFHDPSQAVRVTFLRGKHAAWHALKVVFANEIGTLAKQLQADAEAVTEILTDADNLNISASYLKPGFAFGGSCVPRDVRALNYPAKELDLKLPLFESIMANNDEHLKQAIDVVQDTGNKNVAILGLSFKAATDDLRKSPQVQLVKHLLGEGRNIKIWDDNVSLGRLIGSNREYIEKAIPHIGSLLENDLGQMLKNVEVVVIGTRHRA